MKKVVIMSHTDLDGYSCSYLMGLLIDHHGKEFINVDYSDVKATVESLVARKDEIEFLFITDLNLDLPTAELIDTNFKDRVVLTDHHISGQVTADKYKDWYNLDTSKSATKAVFDSIPLLEDNRDDVTVKVSYFVKCVNAADIFDKSDYTTFRIGREMAYYLNMFIKLLKDSSYIDPKLYTYYIINFLKELNDWCDKFTDSNKFNYNISASKAIFKTVLIKDDIEIKEDVFEHVNVIMLRLALLVASRKFHVYYRGDETIFVYTTPNIAISDVADSLFYNKDAIELLSLVQAPTIVCSIQDNIVSFRSKEFDVSRVAKSFGGGGHKLASGFTITTDKDTLEENIVDRINSFIIEENRKQ